jgi:hypothetical protein
MLTFVQVSEILSNYNLTGYLYDHPTNNEDWFAFFDFDLDGVDIPYLLQFNPDREIINESREVDKVINTIDDLESFISDLLRIHLTH